jgi:hypothetical protein
MPYGQHRIRGTKSYKIAPGRPTRFRFHGVVKRNGKLVRQRLGFNGSKVVEVSFIPFKRRDR